MLKTLKFNNISPDKVFFSGCLHIFHKREFIWKDRGYESIAAHTNGVLDTINQAVGPDDVLFLLGDTFLNIPSEIHCMNFLNQIICQNVYILLGNHNAGIAKLAQGKWGDGGREFYPVKLTDGKYLYGHYIEAEIDKKHCVLSHFPHYIWNKSHHGSYNIHSHCHGSFPLSLPDDTSARRLDVGWDVFKKPVSFTEIRNIMNKKETQILDHHNSTTT